MKGWIKLHRSVLDNDIYKFDPTAWRIFQHLLLNVDSKKGSCTYGRKQLSLQMGNNENTTYKALQRLKSAKMVTLTSNNRFTVINICKWSKYQGNGNSPSNNQVTTGEQPSNNQVTHYKKEEVRNKNKEVVSKDTTISSLYYQVIKVLDLPVRNHNSLKSKINELEKSGNPDTIVKYLEFMRDYFNRATWDYKPSVVEGLDIYNKRKQIEESIKRVQNKPKKGIKV